MDKVVDLDIEVAEPTNIDAIREAYINDQSCKKCKKYKNEKRKYFPRRNRFLINFIVQVCMGFMVAIFSIVMLSLNPNKEEKMVYISLLGTVVGYFLPNPKLKR